MTYTVKPIEDRTWIGQSRSQTSRFLATWSDTEELLMRELGALGAKNIVMRLDLMADQIRLDGRPKANARAERPVVVEFESKHGDLTYRCDRYNELPWRPKMASLWQHNVRAIALTLEALRAVDRYGATQGEQYTGFKALGAGRAMPASHMTSTTACEIFSRLSGVTVTPGESEQSLRARHRQARAASHPDRHDGDRTLWDQVEQAAAVLGVAS